jgi:hypothetical protein
LHDLGAQAARFLQIKNGENRREPEQSDGNEDQLFGRD